MLKDKSEQMPPGGALWMSLTFAMGAYFAV
jgi:hypothetical protein